MRLILPWLTGRGYARPGLLQYLAWREPDTKFGRTLPAHLFSATVFLFSETPGRENLSADSQFIEQTGNVVAALESFDEVAAKILIEEE